MIPSTRPFETDCRIFTTLFGLILTHLFDWHSLKLFLRKVDADVGFITVFIITGTECCRPKRRNIYSPRSMNLKTKELKRRQPKDESEIWLTPMRYHRSDVIHMTSSSVPERIFSFAIIQLRNCLLLRKSTAQWPSRFGDQLWWSLVWGFLLYAWDSDRKSVV